ncbi:hypothetical protein F4810DRAFT_653963 [Camillea tinctor]|nr:hypothetical protein F4810DRAFT_653963 [Camillea tinctor]
MSVINSLVRSVGRSTTLRATTIARQPIQKRLLSESSKRPPLVQGGNNRNIIIGLVGVTIPALAWFTLKDGPMQATNVAAPTLDPALKLNERRENESLPKYRHPEHEDPELKAPFGQVHKRKRVDGPPDDRNHKSLSERIRVA